MKSIMINNYNSLGSVGDCSKTIRFMPSMLGLYIDVIFLNVFFDVFMQPFPKEVPCD